MTIRTILMLAVSGVFTLQAATITPGFTFAVASNSNHATGTHFHSSTGGVFGNPAGKAEVGGFSSEEVRGISEYDLTSLTSSPNAFVTFNVFKAGGLFNGTNDFTFTGIIDVIAYQGNNAENISDYEAASVGTVGSFSTAGLLVGDIISLDITSIFDTAIAGGWSSLGIRLRESGTVQTGTGAWTFDTFRLTSDDQSTNPTAPEPSTLLMLGVPMVLIGLRRKGFFTRASRTEL